jgi:hypothetical protein
VTGPELPRLLVLDDREGLARSTPDIARLDAATPARVARRLDPGELLDPRVVPRDDALGGVLEDPP